MKSFRCLGNNTQKSEDAIFNNEPLKKPQYKNKIFEEIAKREKLVVNNDNFPVLTNIQSPNSSQSAMNSWVSKVKTVSPNKESLPKKEKEEEVIVTCIDINSDHIDYE